jgi:hypothetical protein
MKNLHTTTYSDELTSLMEQSAEIRKKLKADAATQDDYLKLHKLETGFAALRKPKQRLFCKKLKAQYLLFASKHNNEDILEEAHDTAVELVAQSEIQKVTAPSFYKILLQTKLELAKVKLVQGLSEESEALLDCAKRIFKKAEQLFPDYQKFPQAELLALAA